MKKLIVLLIAFLFSFNVCLATGNSSGSDFLYTRLNNGQTLIVKRVEQNPIVTINTWINTGSADETDKNFGVAHFLEHLFFKGTTKYPSGEFERILEGKGAVTNAATSKDYTHYYITLPSKDFDLALSLHADMLQNPLIPRKELEKERPVVLEEIARSTDSPQAVMFNNLFALLYGKHPYAHPVLGNSKIIETITREEIFDFYNNHYTPQHFYTVIVGDIKPDEVLKKVEAEFNVNTAKTADNKSASMTSKEQAKTSVPVKLTPITKPLKTVAKKDVKSSYMTMAYRTEKFSDNKDLYALDVLSAILGEGKSSKLNQILKEDMQIVNSISSSSSILKQDGLFTIQTNYETNNAQKVKTAINDVIERVKKGEITEDEIKKAKNMIETATYYSRESITNISDEMGYCALMSGGMDFYDTYLDKLKKVKQKDVVKAAKKYLLADKVVISIVDPNGVDEVDQNAPKLSPVAHKEDKKPQVLEQNENTTKYLLSNGAELILVKNPNNSIIAINIANKSGNHFEKIPSTLSLAAALAKQGTKNYTSKEFSQILDEKGITMGLSAGNDSFSITVQTTKNELTSAISMLKEVINDPVFSEYEIEKEKKLRLQKLKNLEDNQLAYTLDAFKALAFEGSVYGNNSVIYQKNIPLVSQEDIKNDYHSAVMPNNLVVSVVGDVDADKIIEDFSNMFETPETAAITPKTELKNLKRPDFVPAKNIEKIITKKDTQTAWLILGYKTTDVFNEKDIAALTVINTVLGEGMSSRLFRNLRDSQGLAYQIGSTNLQGALDGTFLTYIGTNPKNLEEAKRGILREFQTLKTEFVSAIELTQAKDKILGNLLLSLETNMDNAQNQSYNAILNRDINYIEKYKKLIESVTQSDVLTVANKYFSRPYVMVILK